jgi:protein SCO1/2
MQVRSHIRPRSRSLAAVLLAVLAIPAVGESRQTVLDDRQPVAHDTAARPSAAPLPSGKAPITQRSVVLDIPPITLVRDDGRPVDFPRELDDGRAVMVNFIFTSCSSICPISSQTFSQVQKTLGAGAPRVHLVSVSIDPEEDTPAALRRYAQKYDAQTGWNHYTGSIEATTAAQKAFGIYKGDKMNHDPVTLLRLAPGRPWVRIDGFATADDLLQTYRRLLAGG